MTIKNLYIEDLILLKEHFNIKSMCESAGLKHVTIHSKINRKTQLTIEESEKLTAILQDIFNKIEKK